MAQCGLLYMKVKIVEGDKAKMPWPHSACEAQHLRCCHHFFVFDDVMLKNIRDCTVAEAHKVRHDSLWDMTMHELKAFIALTYIWGCARWKINKAFGWTILAMHFFKETMYRNRFQEIMWFQSFDNKPATHAYKTTGLPQCLKFGRFVHNSFACYKPGAINT